MAHANPLPARRLNKWCDAELGRALALAKACGIHFSIVSRWRTGERVPAVKHRPIIEQMCGIPVREWDRVAPPKPTPFEAAFGGVE